MTKIELARRLRQEAGIAGTGPLSTINQTGELKRVVDWIDGAWAEIQQAFNWDFLWESATVTISAATNATSGTIPAKRYIKSQTYNGTAQMRYLPWADFRQTWPQVLIADGTPTVWTIRPDKAFVVNAKPSSNTDLTVERYKNPIAMTVDSDEPALPAEHHMAIVWKALLLYANFEEAGVTRETARREYDRHMTALGVLELPDMPIGEPLL